MNAEIKLIDLSAVFHACWHATENMPASECERNTIGKINEIAGEAGTLVAICCDSKSNWRKKLDPTYKAQRDKAPDLMYGTLDKIKARLKSDGYLLWECDGFEADDVIATAVDQAASREHAVLICSADKDLFQLLGVMGVQMLRTHTGERVNEAWMLANDKIGVQPSQFGDFLAMCGDKSDNILGADGIGPKKAADLLKKFGDLAGIFKAAKEDATNDFWKSRQAVLSSLIEHETRVLNSRKLIALRFDAPIVFDEIFAERKITPRTKDDMEAEYLDGVFGADSENFKKVPQEAPKVTTTPKINGKEDPVDAVFEQDKITIGPAEATPTPAQAALVVQTNPVEIAMSEFSRDLEPTGMRGMYWLMRRMHESRLYEKFKSPEAMLACAMRGKSLGFDPVTSLDVFHVVKGKPSLVCHVISALAEKHPDFEYLMLVSSDYKQATYEGKRKGHPRATTHTFTIEDAVNHGYCGLEIVPRTAKQGDEDKRGQWDKSRPEMLRKTAMVQLIRILWPGSSMGLYSVEEMETA